jgi:hypothetical protein
LLVLSFEVLPSFLNNVKRDFFSVVGVAEAPTDDVVGVIEVAVRPSPFAAICNSYRG